VKRIFVLLILVTCLTAVRFSWAEELDLSPIENFKRNHPGACTEFINAFCQENNTNKLHCLDNNYSNLPQNCKDTVTRALQLNKVFKTCDADIKSFCDKSVKTESAKLICLKGNTQRLSLPCLSDYNFHLTNHLDHAFETESHTPEQEAQ